MLLELLRSLIEDLNKVSTFGHSDLGLRERELGWVLHCNSHRGEVGVIRHRAVNVRAVGPVTLQPSVLRCEAKPCGHSLFNGLLVLNVVVIDTLRQLKSVVVGHCLFVCPSDGVVMLQDADFVQK
jgi:hypothetical protein